MSYVRSISTIHSLCVLFRKIFPSITISAVDGTRKPVLGHFVKVSLLFKSELAISSSFFPHFAWNAHAIVIAG